MFPRAAKVLVLVAPVAVGSIALPACDAANEEQVKECLLEQLATDELKKELSTALHRLQMEMRDEDSDREQKNDAFSSLDEGEDVREDVEEEEDETDEGEFESDYEGDLKSITSSPGSFHVDQNLTFGKGKTRDIAMENIRLAERLAKMRRQLKPKPEFPRTVVASSAINRKKMQWDIERKNVILARRIADAKSCLSYKPKFLN